MVRYGGCGGVGALALGVVVHFVACCCGGREVRLLGAAAACSLGVA